MAVFKREALSLFMFFICIALEVTVTGGKTYLKECQRCKVFTDSFSYWLDKTARGKFDGGDAAWEETKLKSYSRSEVRLVEIQEGLCSEIKKFQDVCYTLAEETETVIEKWWMLNDPQSMDLYTWLCIETLQYCCPINHFGSSCYPCPMTDKNMICSGHGKCDGEGTRKGNGTCLCDKGYAGSNCEICAKNFFSLNVSCKPCHRACNECTGQGVDACIDCNAGWQKDSGTCIDVNECLDSSTCRYNEYCTNRQGSHACKLCDNSCKTCEGEGMLNCTSCESDSILWSGRCVNDSLKSEILRNTIKKAALYTGLLIIAFFVFQHSRTLASITIVIIAMYVYYSEKASDLNIFDVLLNLYLN